MRSSPSRWSVLAVLCAAMGAWAFTGPSPGGDRSGQDLFIAYCARCHGPDGTKGKWGAKNLRLTPLQAKDIVHQVTTGKGVMPSFKKKMTPEEVERLAAYVVALRQ
mgnify:CR=1 FL=1